MSQDLTRIAVRNLLYSLRVALATSPDVPSFISAAYADMPQDPKPWWLLASASLTVAEMLRLDQLAADSVDAGSSDEPLLDAGADVQAGTQMPMQARRYGQGYTTLPPDNFGDSPYSGR